MFCFLFCFKQKTAYEMRISDWSSDVCSSDLANTGSAPGVMAEMLIAALNVNAMLWKTSPAATELEERALDWLRQMMGLGTGSSEERRVGKECVSPCSSRW